MTEVYTVLSRRRRGLPGHLKILDESHTPVSVMMITIQDAVSRSSIPYGTDM